MEREIKTFIVDPADDYTAKSKDALSIKYLGVTDQHFAGGWSIVHAYRVENLKKGSVYTVHFFATKDTNVLMVECDCVAHLRCKHICLAVKKHLGALRLGFLLDTTDLLTDEQEKKNG